MRKVYIVSTVILILSQPSGAQETKPVDKTGAILPVVEKPISLMKRDRIVFFGDSITAAGVNKNGYIAVMKEHLSAKHKELELELIGAGVGGNKVPNLQARVATAVLARKPTIVFIYIGINDVWHDDFGKGTPKDQYEAGLKDIIGKIKAGGAQVILCTPSVIGEKTDGSNKHDSKLNQFAEVSRTVAREMKVGLCDLRKGFLATLRIENSKKLEFGVLTSDRVHLNEAGNRLVAEMMLNQLGESLKKPTVEGDKSGGSR